VAGQDARISFYVLADADPRARLLFACRLTEKAWQLGHRIHAECASAEAAAEFDDLLWTFRQGSFVPHVCLPAAIATDDCPPVTIGHGSGSLPEADLLINLAATPAEGWSGFTRVAEIVAGTPDEREEGRKRFRWYRAQGLEPETFKV